jgi:hypothetical protein
MAMAALSGTGERCCPSLREAFSICSIDASASCGRPWVSSQRPVTGGHHLINGRVDGRVLAADTGARDEAGGVEVDEPAVPFERQRREAGADHVDRQGPHAWVSLPDTELAIVISRPSRIQAVPSPSTSRVWNGDHLSRSSRAGMVLRTGCCLAASKRLGLRPPSGPQPGAPFSVPTAMAAARCPARPSGTWPGCPRGCSGGRKRAWVAGGPASWPARPLRSGRSGTFR